VPLVSQSIEGKRTFPHSLRILSVAGPRALPLNYCFRSAQASDVDGERESRHPRALDPRYSPSDFGEDPKIYISSRMSFVSKLSTQSNPHKDNGILNAWDVMSYKHKSMRH